LGLASHLFIACVFAALYVMASRRWRALIERPVLLGGVYGLAIFFVMNYVVVPLSAATVSGPKGIFYPLGLLVHIFLVGVPIALFARRA
jgi:uncharacterized membrane protein YagU involved in acid resistance